MLVDEVADNLRHSAPTLLTGARLDIGALRRGEADRNNSGDASHNGPSWVEGRVVLVVGQLVKRIFKKDFSRENELDHLSKTWLAWRGLSYNLEGMTCGHLES